MLHLILGRAGSGKTTYLRSLLAQRAAQGETGMILLVPDQYSFESEKAMLDLLGTSGTESVETMGFSRLCELVLRSYGGSCLPILEEGGRTVVMRTAIRQCADRLTVYRRHAERDSFVSSLLSLVTECKRAAVTPQALLESAAQSGEESLLSKTRELSLLLSSYDALLQNTAADPSDALTRAGELLRGRDFFAGRVVAVDSFKGFTGQQMKLLEQILAQAKEVYLTLPCEGSKRYRESVTDLFSNVCKTKQQIKKLAEQYGVGVRETLLDEPHRFEKEALAAVERRILRDTKIIPCTDPDGVELWRAGDLGQEAGFAAGRIVSLVRREGYRFREIAVIARDTEHTEEMVAALDRCGLPCFADRRVPLKSTPLARLCHAMLSFAETGAPGFLFAALRTGLSRLQEDDIAAAEEYVRLWSLDAKSWEAEWTKNPDGFCEDFTEAQRTELAHLNGIRLQLLEFADPYRIGLRRAKTGAEYSKTLFEALTRTGIGEQLSARGELLRAEGDAAAAQTAIDTWGAMMGLLDQLALSLPDEVTLTQYASFFSLVSLKTSVGSLPQGVDEITVGTADRMRPACPRAVIILGANQDVFPAAPDSTGLLTRRERETLNEHDAGLPDCGVAAAVEEHFLAYTALSAAREKLIVCYSETDCEGQTLYPSRVVTDLKKIFPSLTENSVREREEAALAGSVEDAEEWICAPSAGLTVYAAHRDTALGASLRRALENSGNGETVRAVEQGAAGLPATLSPQTAKTLYPGNLKVSPTAVEHYYSCPFRYFCGYGLSARRPVSAALDSQHRGTLVHYVLQKLIETRGSKAFSAMSETERNQEIGHWMCDYRDKAMGGEQGKSVRFRRDFESTREMLELVAANLSEELALSDYETAACELPIGTGGDEQVAPVSLPLSDGSRITLRGIVDRVDLFRQGEDAYLRIVDYKTGVKKLQAKEVFEGINLQMLCYLFALRRNAASLFGVRRLIPAGVLYLPARGEEVRLPYGCDEEQARRLLRKSMKMDGMLLNDPVSMQAMGGEAGADYLPYSYSEKTHKPYKSDTLVSGTVMERLQEKTDGLLVRMGEEIKAGRIAVDPFGNEEKGSCHYCDYRAVCGLPANAERRQLPEAKFSGLDEEVGENG